MKRLLLLGANGRLGWELRRALAPLGELSCPSRDEADLARPDTLAAFVSRRRPDVIVNAAAYTDVDRAESERALAHTLNADAPAALARVACELGALLVQYSTDCVFDGSGEDARDEDAATAPVNAYGASKLAGEERVCASGCRHLILRTGWLHAARGDNFVRRIARLAGERETMAVVADQVGAPTGADGVADITAHLLRAQAEGLFHLTASGATSRHALALEVVAWLRAQGRPLAVRELQAVPSSAWPAAAQRPLNARLDTRRLRERHGLALPHWRVGVERLLAEAFLP